ncbi:MAG TPA: hypothetical protein VFF65_12935 [Phycisphaerales bacterium]|nr:hypothetical protein [Phycisphaerales bacterium]
MTEMTVERFRRILTAQHPPRPRTVMIVALWLSGSTEMHRERTTGEWLDEWRISRRAYDDLRDLARSPDSWAIFCPNPDQWRSEVELPWMYGARPAVFETYPPGDLFAGSLLR